MHNGYKYQDVPWKITGSDILKLLPQFTKEADKLLESIVTADRHQYIVSLPKHDNLECSGHTQLLQQPKDSKCISLLQKLWHLHLVMWKESPASKTVFLNMCDDEINALMCSENVLINGDTVK
jgi:hypothetical protein